MNKRLACVLGAVAIAVVALTPSNASAGWGQWGGPGISITIGPRYGYYRPYGYYGYRPYGYYGYRPYRYGYRRPYLGRYAYRGWRRYW